MLLSRLFVLIVVATIVLGSDAFMCSSLRNHKMPLKLKMAAVIASDKKMSVGIVGATGAVGEEILGVMEQRGFKVSNIKLYASEKSSGKIVSSKVYGNLPLEPFTFESAKSLDVVFLAVGGDFSLEWAEKLASNGVLVIDNSSAFRYKDDIPLVIPEINIKAAKGKKLIANPNCTTAIALMALWPIHQRFKIKKAIISTYQAASGAGAAGMQELKDGMQKACNGEAVVNQVFAHPLPYNIIPQIDVFQDNAYTKEEMKVAWESRKIMEVPNLKVSCTAVRIPTLRAHSEAITLETELPITANEVRKILSNAPGVDLIDEPSNKRYPMPLTATKKYNIEVGRIRENDVFDDKGLDLFVSGDQLLRGAALNAVIIAEMMRDNQY